MRCDPRALLLAALLACRGAGEPCLRHSDCGYGEVCAPTGACLAPLDAADGDADVDAPADADEDADVDAATDAGVDAPTDAPVDAPTDAAVDAPVDAPTDAPIDAAPIPGTIRHPQPTGPVSEDP